MSLVDDEVRFAADLYRGTAGYYDRYRLPYPEAMIEDLARTAQVSGRGRLLDVNALLAAIIQTHPNHALVDVLYAACPRARLD